MCPLDEDFHRLGFVPVVIEPLRFGGGAEEADTTRRCPPPILRSENNSGALEGFERGTEPLHSFGFRFEVEWRAQHGGRHGAAYQRRETVGRAAERNEFVFAALHSMLLEQQPIRLRSIPEAE